MIEEIGGDFLQWLRGFYHVAQKGSMTQAALEMGRNQPTISHQIKCLEKEFGVTLFDRSSRKMELTPEGKVLLEKAISLFEIIKEFKSEINQDRFPQEGRIVIATTHAIIDFYLPRYIVEFRKVNPGVVFEMEGGGVEMICEKVESSEADFGIACFDTIPLTMSYSDLFETELKLIAPKNNSFFSSKSPSLKEIAKPPFIFFPRSSTITPFIEKRFSESKLRLNVSLILNNFESVKKFVAFGLGVSILDDYTLTQTDEKKLDIFSLERFFTKRKYTLIVRRRKYLSPIVRAFIRTIKPEILPKTCPHLVGEAIPLRKGF